jgi:hypothetical protein
VEDRALEATEAVTDGVMQARMAGKWDRLNPIEMVGKMNAAKAMLTEQAISAIEFPQEKTASG